MNSIFVSLVHGSNLFTMTKDIIIFDLDGTICDVEHRRKFVASKPKNWDAWNKGLSADKPHLPVKFIFDCISYMVKNHTDITIAFVSGRSEEYRDETIHWLNLNGFGNYTSNLYMRKKKDNRNDAIIKSEIADEIEKEYNILCVFDDRKRVVDMWINRGIFVFDVGQGKGDF